MGQARMSLPAPYYDDGNGIVIYQADARDILPSLPKSDLILTDPPYGIAWRRGARGAYRPNSESHSGIIGDEDTSLRDEVLMLVKDTPALVFGSFYAPFPERLKQVLVYHKPSYSGLIGATTPFRRDAEPIFLLGEWSQQVPVSSSVFHAVNGLNGSGEQTGHPHTKPLAVIYQLLAACPARDICDPFMGSGSVLVAAKQLGRRCVGIEIEEKYCAIAVERLRQSVFDFSAPAEPQPEQLLL
jgi:DNA modification methylase